jgi:phenylalanyl-tRNA synthetase alpha subunit
MLYRLAQDGFKPAKYFSVDRVFRNEDIDRTHLAEFHQIEGLICDRGLTLGDLIGTLHAFFERMGLKKLRFKPAYNPYTEPSMEIFRCAPAVPCLCIAAASVHAMCQRPRRGIIQFHEQFSAVS